ncbi:MAG: LytTR family DNA-binding domain-containing protein [Acetatifactor sp.]|nr:LytTR family DNA-binding domain-containing protein [Acetatifactor sp.]
MRVAICDDEAVQQQILRKYLEEWAQMKDEVLETELFISGESFLFAWEDDRDYDLLILDIEMGQLNGMELAEKIRSQDENIPILFVTGYDRYMSQGYEVSALHYLLKPLHKEKLFEVLDKVKKTGKDEEKQLFQTDKGPVSMPLSKIWYVEARAHQCILYTEKDEYTIYSGINETAELLEKYREFVRCHRSYVVNVRHILAAVKSELVLDDNRRLPVSRNSEKRVKQAFMQMFKG